MIKQVKLCDRTGTVYIAVMGVALIMGVISLTAMQIARIQLRTATVVDEMALARLAAQSSIEFALCQIDTQGSNWRSEFTSDTVVGPIALGSGTNATMSWVISDSDGDLTDEDTELMLRGIGSIGDSLKVNQVLLRIDRSDSETNEQVLHSYTEQSKISDVSLASNSWFGQYLKIPLPASAIGWRITDIDLFFGRKNTNEDFSVRIYNLGDSNLPNTIIDSLDLNSSSFRSTPAWHNLEFSGDHQITAGDAIGIAVETTALFEPIDLRISTDATLDPDSALMLGDPNWRSIESSMSMLYRVRGVYWTQEGNIEVISGGWRWVESP